MLLSNQIKFSIIYPKEEINSGIYEIKYYSFSPINFRQNFPNIATIHDDDDDDEDDEDDT